MRILHCLRAPVGGLFRHVLDLAEAQARAGHDVGILADSNAQDRLTQPKFAAVAPLLALGIHQIPMRRQPGLGDWSAYRAVRAAAEPLALDVLHGHGAKGGAYARLASRDLKRRGQRVASFYTPHGGSLNYRPGTLEGRFFLGLERMLDSMTSGLIFESAYAADVYRTRVCDTTTPYRVIPNGLKAGDFVAAAPSAAARDVLFIGELRAIKGIDHLLRALAELNRERSVTATIVGSGPQAEELQSLAAELGLGDKVEFTGAMPARDAFALGRVMVVPSLAESFPYVVLEAAAAGLPLIATSVGGIPEIVSGTDTGLIAPGSSEAIVTALRAILADPQAAAERAKRLRTAVGTRFTVGSMAETVLDFYGTATASGLAVKKAPQPANHAA